MRNLGTGALVLVLMSLLCPSFAVGGVLRVQGERAFCLYTPYGETQYLASICSYTAFILNSKTSQVYECWATIEITPDHTPQHEKIVMKTSCERAFKPFDKGGNYDFYIQNPEPPGGGKINGIHVFKVAWIVGDSEKDIRVCLRTAQPIPVVPNQCMAVNITP